MEVRLDHEDRAARFGAWRQSRAERDAVGVARDQQPALDLAELEVALADEGLDDAVDPPAHRLGNAGGVEALDEAVDHDEPQPLAVRAATAPE